MVEASARQITTILQRWSQGDDHALDSLMPLVYHELRRIASYILKGERPGNTLQPTALVSEAYLKLAGGTKMRWQDRAHFFAVAARAMRQILVDYARRHQREKRGGKAQRLQLDEALVFAVERSEELLALDEAMDRLAAVDQRKARVVELRFFAGLENKEIGEVLNVSANTVMRDWNLAKAWLRREMQSGETHG